MTRFEIVDWCTKKLNETDADTLAQVAVFADDRYKLIWNDADWQDVHRIIITTATEGEVILPSIIDRVLAVRSGGVVVPQVGIATVMDYDPAYFDAIGSPTQYRNATQVALDVSPAGGKFKVNSSQTSDNTKIFVRGDYLNNEMYEEMTLNGSGQVETTNNYDNVYHIGKGLTDGDITARKSSDNSLLGTIPKFAREKKNIRINLLAAPTSSTPLLIVARLRCPGFVNDYDGTMIRGIEFALKEFVLYDMLQTQRQFATAELSKATANALLQQAKNQEMLMAQFTQRIIPVPDNFDRSNWLETLP